MTLSEPQKYILTSPAEINLFLAGVGSGKTHLAGIVSGFFAERCPNVSGFIGANTYGQLNTSTMLRIREVWRSIFGWEHGRDYVINIKPPPGFDVSRHNFDGYGGICSFKNGAIAFLGSLDNAKAHDGKEFAWSILDETKDTKEVDVKETIITRLRQSGMYLNDGRIVSDSGTPFNPLYIFTSPAKVQWLNEMFSLDAMRNDIERKIFSKDRFFGNTDKMRCVAISSTYHNASNLPAGYIDRVIATNSKDRADALIYGNPFTKTGGEFYTGFSAVANVGNTVYLPNIPIHVTFDQNVVPYITALIWQIDGGVLRCIDEFCLPNPHNTTERLCDAILAKYGQHTGGLFFYGDASGNARSTKGSETDYQIVTRKFRALISNNSNRVSRSNPPVGKRRDFINNLLEGKVSGWSVVVDSKCKTVVADLTYLKQDQNGLKLKERAKDESTGQTFEKYGHTSDAMDYFLTTVLSGEFTRHLKEK